jgi:hypothetical protein
VFTRLEVEGGFLHGLDLELVSGLNVLIGARGTGKTSVIELVRFCLGLAAYTPTVQRRASDHARSILEGGEVRLTFRDPGGTEHRVIRGADDEVPSLPDAVRFRSAIVLAQNEIERVGLDKEGRLRLLDGFVDSLGSLQQREDRALSAIASVTHQIAGAVDAIRQVEERIAQATAVEQQLVGLDDKAIEVQPDSAFEQLRGALRRVDQQVASGRARVKLLERVRGDVTNWGRQIDVVVNAAPGEATWPEAATLEIDFDHTRSDLAMALAMLTNARATIEDTAVALSSGVDKTRSDLSAAEELARELRADLEARQEGAGRQAQQLARLVQVRGELESTAAVLSARRTEATALQRQRSALLDQLDELRLERYDGRRVAAEALNRRLGPTVHVEVRRLGLYDEYAGAIAAALRGSGIHYTKLAGAIAERMTPRELCEAVEVGDAETLATVVEIPEDRAGRLVDALRDAGTSDIIVAPVEDSVDLFLLDGVDYKRTDELSTGQRCTIVLPILLCHTDLTILIDQPEDHLDNAFIVETVVATIRERAPNSQFVFATHNANIPVLGEADSVTLLASDGRRGFVRTAGPLNSAATRAAVSRVMEGGPAAFAKRAAFYSSKQQDQ